MRRTRVATFFDLVHGRYLLPRQLRGARRYIKGSANTNAPASRALRGDCREPASRRHARLNQSDRIPCSATFFLALGWSELRSAIGLIIGGVLAARLGGYLVARIPTQPLMLAVSVL